MPYKPKRNYSTKKIIVKPKVNWSLKNYQTITSVSPPTKEANKSWPSNKLACSYSVEQLVGAQIDGSGVTPIGMNLKVKHLKCEITRSFFFEDIDMYKALIKMKAYIVYLPEGVVFSKTVNTETGMSQTLSQHPEWILGEKMLNINYKSDSQYVSSTTVKMKLNKNLRSGDNICVVLATTFDTEQLGDKDWSAYKIPVNLEWSYASAL